MDQTLLVVDRIGAGEDLLRALRDEGFEVEVAFWTQDQDDDWKLIIASPEVDRLGAKQAHLVVNKLIQSRPSWRLMDPFEIMLIGTSERISRAISSYANRWVGRSLHNAASIRHEDVILGRTFIYPKSLSGGSRP